jgi:phosphatidylserine decarboxylase
MLRNQSVSMGKQYDDPQSKDHIQPFIDSFHLKGSLSELKVCRHALNLL